MYNIASIYTGSSDYVDEEIPSIVFEVGSANNTVACANVSIVGDQIIEDNEEFTVEFTPVNQLDEFDRVSSTYITIEDDDGMSMNVCCVIFN